MTQQSTSFKTRIAALATLAAMGLALVPGTALAQDDFPNRPVRIVVPFPPGGSGDALARAVGQKLSAQWKQQVIVDNKPGAGTVIGADAVAKSKPDGYTLGLINSSYTANPSLRAKLPFDTLKDLVGVAPLAGLRIMFLVNPSVPANTIPELVELSKRKPLNYGSPGVGSGTHLAGEFLNLTSGSKLNHIAYKGSAPALVELLGGRIEMVIDVFTATNAQYVKTGKLKMIAITGDERLKDFPSVALLREAYPELEVPGFMGLIGPAGMPRPLLVKINADVMAATQTAELSQQIASIGLESYKAPGDVDRFNALLRSEIAKWGKVIKATGIQAE